MVILLAIALILLFLLVFDSKNKRESILRASIIWGTILTAIVELLSLFYSITFCSVSILWLFSNIFLIFLLAQKLKKEGKNIKFNLELNIFSFLPLHVLILLIGIITIILIIGFIALISPPNTWDSMTYHLPRVVHWIQNKTVAHYPTNFLPQLYYTPWSEYAILNLQVLSGSDRFANLVQWMAMIGCLIGVSLIAEQLGSSHLGQVFSIVFTATLPMGILQASSTKNDYTVAFWLVCLAYFVLIAMKSKKIVKTAPIIGLSLGLAVFTKPTAYPYAFPFLIWFLSHAFMQNRQSFLECLSLISIPALLINLGLFWRNFLLFGKPIFSHAGYQTEITNFNLFASNIIKNLALHFPIPLIPDHSQAVEKSIIWIHRSLLHVDINDPRITPSNIEFILPRLFNFESNAPNSLHFYLFFITFFVYFLTYKKNKNNLLNKYLLALLFAFLIFCYLAKWQPWQSRLHLGLFVLCSPFVGIVFSNIFNQKITVYLSLFLIGYSSFWVFCNESRPILSLSTNIFNTSRLEQYFSTRSDLQSGYFQAVEIIKRQNCSNIGLILQGDYWEYPFWVLLQEKNNNSIHIQHMQVANISVTTNKKFEKNWTPPCVILTIDGYIKASISTRFGIYKQQNPPIPISRSGYLQIYQQKF